MKRKHISLKTKLAAALSQLFLTHQEARLASEEEVLKLVNWEHYPIPHAHRGPDTHWNLVPTLRAAHREKTAKIDVPQIAKTKRISREQEAFRVRMLTPRDERPPKRSKWASRPFQKRSRKNDNRTDRT